ncbi:MAG TPA: protein-disulfide reductase DsbD domain-containing protein [Terriglobales bacterium]|nr:protein-disulfide reductase DsbD domain-containing protein [Terriglobales bacterium]
MSPAPLSSIHAGTPGQIELRFHVAPSFHINSNTPKSEFLIPTVLKLNAPTDIVIGRVTYPKGQELSFPFAPEEKLSVYSGTFNVGVVVRPMHDVVPIKYMIRGNLRYQACDKAACYPPKNLPVQFEVKVAKPVPTAHKGNPAQSPHIHKPQQ